MIRIGIVSPADIAYRRFMPALQSINGMKYIGVAIYSAYERFGKGDSISQQDREILDREEEKGNRFISTYGGKLFYSYSHLICSDEIDAIYIPLPPALHDVYAVMAIEHGKHVLVEKPSAITYGRTEFMTKLANERNLAIYENYMFIYHDQIKELKKIIKERIGEVRLYSLKFGFPKRQDGDFRYKKELGGGSLLDAGGYTLKLAGLLLGKSSRVICSVLNKTTQSEVDIYGTATLINDEMETAQVAFGMDNAYKCEIEVWGNTGSVKTERIFTAPPDLQTTAKIYCGNTEEMVDLAVDDAFKKSIEEFKLCIINSEHRKREYQNILQQAKLVDQAMTIAHAGREA